MRRLPIFVLLLMPFSLNAQEAAPEQDLFAEDPLWERVEVLETMISMWPKQEYYVQLASLYGRVGDFDRQLELYEISLAMGWLTETRQFIQLARLLLRSDRYDEVDEILDKALEVELAASCSDIESPFQNPTN